jgi:hypothetical protein
MPHPQARPRVTTRSHEVQDHHQHRHTPTTHTAHRHTPRGPASPACRDARAATDRHRDREPWPNHVWPKLSQSRGQYTESFGHGSCAAVHISYYMSCLWRARRSSIINVVEDRFVWLRGVNNTTCEVCVYKDKYICICVPYKWLLPPGASVHAPHPGPCSRHCVMLHATGCMSHHGTRP